MFRCSYRESTLTGWGRGKDWDMNSRHGQGLPHILSVLRFLLFSPYPPYVSSLPFPQFSSPLCSFVFVCFSIASRRICWGCQGFKFHWDDEQNWELQVFFYRRYEIVFRAPQTTTEMAKIVHVHESHLLIRCCLLSWFVASLFQRFCLPLVSFFIAWINGVLRLVVCITSEMLELGWEGGPEQW